MLGTKLDVCSPRNKNSNFFLTHHVYNLNSFVFLAYKIDIQFNLLKITLSTMRFDLAPASFKVYNV